MRCYYHKADLDGHCSGAIIKLKYPGCEMIGVNYNDSLASLDISLKRDEIVFVVDFSFSMSDMRIISEICELYWIDHHKTSIEEASKSGFIVSGGQSLEIGKAGCELTWEFICPDKEMPDAVRYIGRYDVWDHREREILPFQYGMRVYRDTKPESNSYLWDMLFSNSYNMVNETLKTGEIILNYQIQQDKKYAKDMSYETEFEGYRAIVMNKPYSNSKVFDSVYDPVRHDIMVLFGVKSGQCKYSIYCEKDDIDVSEIAKKYGGGGHKGAAGFYTEKPII